MPLIKSASRSAVGKNIRDMMDAGHPQKQAVAAALENQRRVRAKRKKKRRRKAEMSAARDELVYLDGTPTSSFKVHSMLLGRGLSWERAAFFAASCERVVFDEDGKWTEIGGGPGPHGEKHAGGTAVEVSKDGTILKGGPKELRGVKVSDSGKVLRAKSGKGETGHPELDKALAKASALGTRHERNVARVKAVSDHAGHIAAIAASGHDAGIRDKAEKVVRDAFADSKKEKHGELAAAAGAKKGARYGGSAEDSAVAAVHGKIDSHLKESMKGKDVREVKADARAKLAEAGYRPPGGKQGKAPKEAKAGVDHKKVAAGLDAIRRHAGRLGKSDEGQHVADKRARSLVSDKMSHKDLDKVADHLGRADIKKLGSKAQKVQALRHHATTPVSDAAQGHEVRRADEAAAEKKKHAADKEERSRSREDLMGHLKDHTDDQLDRLKAARKASAKEAAARGDRKGKQFHERIAKTVGAEQKRRAAAGHKKVSDSELESSHAKVADGSYSKSLKSASPKELAERARAHETLAGDAEKRGKKGSAEEHRRAGKRVKDEMKRREYGGAQEKREGPTKPPPGYRGPAHPVDRGLDGPGIDLAHQGGDEAHAPRGKASSKDKGEGIDLSDEDAAPKKTIDIRDRDTGERITGGGKEGTVGVDHKAVAGKVAALKERAEKHAPKKGESEQEAEKRARGAGEARAGIVSDLKKAGIGKKGMTKQDYDEVARHLGHSEADIAKRKTKEESFKAVAGHALKPLDKARKVRMAAFAAAWFPDED